MGAMLESERNVAIARIEVELADEIPRHLCYVFVDEMKSANSGCNQQGRL